MNRKFDSIKRTRVLLNLALDHFQQSQQFEISGDLQDARYELATAEEYRDMYWYRMESDDRGERKKWQGNYLSRHSGWDAKRPS